MINNNIEEPHCSFEVSELLKKKGFDCECSYITNKKTKEKAEEVGRMAKLGKKAFKQVTLGSAGNEESLFILGFIAGYKKKENETTSS